MREKDQLTQNLSPSARIDVPCCENLMQRNVTARTAVNERMECGSAFGPMGDFATIEKDYRTVGEYHRHWFEQGGMTFGRGDILPDEK